MANAIKKYDNGLSIRYLKKPSAYFITFGVTHIKVNGTYLKGFADFKEAEDFLNTLKREPYKSSYSWSV